MKCDGYRILIEEMLQGRLNIDEATLVAGHMDACESCRSFHRSLVRGNDTGKESSAATVSAPQPMEPRGSVWPVAIAVILAMVILGGIALMATHAGWRRATSSYCPGHHSFAQGHSR